jgi:hypothetical protein
MERLSKNSIAVSGLSQIVAAPRKPRSGFGDVDRSILLAGRGFLPSNAVQLVFKPVPFNMRDVRGLWGEPHEIIKLRPGLIKSQSRWCGVDLIQLRGGANRRTLTACLADEALSLSVLQRLWSEA